MNYDRSGQFGAPRRRTPPSMPVGLSVSDTLLSRSDLPPTEHQSSFPTFANRTQNHDYSRSPNRDGDSAPHSWGLKNHPLAMVYSPLQSFCSLYDEDTAFERGTLFSELDLPFEGSKCGKDRC